MAYIRLQAILGNVDAVESYILFRKIEDWCYEKLSGRYQLDYSYSICAYGVDVAGGIIFNTEEDAAAFILVFGSEHSLDR